MTVIAIEEDKDSVMFDVRVIPRSSKSGIVGTLDGALKVKLKSPPVDGAANEELIRLIANKFDIPRFNIAIISGLTSKKKRLRIYGSNVAEIHAVLKAKS